jgi:alkylation response protein AidB-like acyl-CoA dehydrogenase
MEVGEMAYAAPLAEFEATLAHMVGADALAQTARFAEVGPETRSAVFAEAAKLCAQVLAPLNRIGDREGARLEGGAVRTPEGFAAAYGAIRDGGWTGVSADPAHGGMGLPQTLWTVVNEMMCGANLSLSICPLLTNGAIEALEAHASDPLKALYLPKLISGAWTGVMCLTEPQAGTDVGAVRTLATPDGDAWRLDGQKIYISWGDHDCAENVVHLVLARTAGAAEGSRGLSLFLVPKFLPDERGAPGARNGVRCIGLEQKLGLHGSPTCTMAYEGARGWLVGAEGKGLACMFTFMNNARLGVGVQGIGVAEAALQKAVAYAQERRQGRTPIGDGAGPIADHADVRRMLLAMRARVAASRAVALACAVAIDMSRAADEPERPGWAARAAFLTPIAKSFGTDIGCEVASLGMQVHGGMGYIEDSGAAQFWRDVRVTAIYEGTNGVQAMDLVGRKLADGGAAAEALLGEITGEARGLAGGDLAPFAERLEAARGALSAATEWMLAAPPLDRGAGAVAYQRAWALTLGALFLLRGAAADPRYRSLAEYFVRVELPHVAALATAAQAGAAPLYADGAL